MGGIIFNIIFAIISTLLLIFTNNIYFRLIHILNIGINVYLALYNSVPAITKSGANTDTLQIIYYLDDNEYINTMSKFHTLQTLLSKGIDLKDIDSKLFSIPQKFKTNNDVLNALIYIDYLSSKEQYNEAIEYIKIIMEKAKELLSKQNLITLKLQLINCIFYSSDNLKQIENIWDKEIKKYLDLMGKVSPIYIGFNYMYATLIEKNESNSKKYLKQFKQLNKKNYNKNDIEETEKLIKDVNNKIKN